MPTVRSNGFAKPVAFNSDGDFAMLEWVAGGTGARFALIVHHDDAVREFAYDREADWPSLIAGSTKD